MLQSFVPKLGMLYCFNGPAWFLSACLLIWLFTPYLQYILSKIMSNAVFIMVECSAFFVQLAYLVGIYLLGIEEQRYFMYVFPPINLLIYLEAMTFVFAVKHNILWWSTKRQIFQRGSFLLLMLMYLTKNLIPVDFRISFWQIPAILLVCLLATKQEGKSIFFESSLLVKIGNMSTAIFLFHYSVIHFLDIIGVMDIQGLGVIAGFVITCVLGYCLERKGNRKYEKGMHGSS